MCINFKYQNLKYQDNYNNIYIDIYKDYLIII